MNMVHIIKIGMIYRVLKSLLPESISFTRNKCCLKFHKGSVLWLKISSMQVPRWGADRGEKAYYN